MAGPVPNAVFNDNDSSISIPAELEIKNLGGSIADLDVLKKALEEAKESTSIVVKMTTSLLQNYRALGESQTESNDTVTNTADVIKELNSLTTKLVESQKSITIEASRVLNLKEQEVQRQRELVDLAEQRLSNEQKITEEKITQQSVETDEGGGPGQLSRIRSELGGQLKNLYGSKVQGALPRSGAMGEITGALSKLKGMPGGAAAPYAGAALGAIGAGYLAYQGVESLMQTQQQYSQLTGGTGMMEAQGYEMQARMMSLSPLISNSQAREVIQEGLRQGYGGTEQFETVTDFMASNMKKYGMSAKASMDLYKTAVEESGGSVEELTNAMEMMADSAKKGGQSLQSLQAGFGATVSALSGIGAGPGATTAASYLTQAFAGNKALEGVQSQIAGAIYSPGFGTQLAQELGLGSYIDLPGAISQLEEEGRTGELSDAVISTIGKIAQRVGITADMSKTDILQSRMGFMLQAQLQAIGLNLDINQAAELAVSALGAGTTEKGAATTAAQVDQQEVELYGERARGAGGYVSGGMRFLGNEIELATVGFIPGRALANTRTSLESYYSGYQGSVGGKILPLVEKLLNDNALNQRDLRVIDEQGKSIPLEDYVKKGGQSALLKLQRGVVKIKSNKAGERAEELFGMDEGKTLADAYGADVLAGIQSSQLTGGYDPSSYTNAGSTNTGTFTPSGAKGSGSSLIPTNAPTASPQKVDVQTGVTIDLSPEARRFLKTTSTTNQVIDEKADVGSSERNSLRP